MLSEHNRNLSDTATAHCKLPVRATFSGQSPKKRRFLEGSITANRKAESAWNLLMPVPMLAYCTLPVSAAINWLKVLHGVLQVARLTLPVDMLSIAAMGICVPVRICTGCESQLNFVLASSARRHRYGLGAGTEPK